jgi:hypothetical protein
MARTKITERAYTVAEMAVILGVSESRVYEQVRKGFFRRDADGLLNLVETANAHFGRLRELAADAAEDPEAPAVQLKRAQLAIVEAKLKHLQETQIDKDEIEAEYWRHVPPLVRMMRTLPARIVAKAAPAGAEKAWLAVCEEEVETMIEDLWPGKFRQAPHGNRIDDAQY